MGGILQSRLCMDGPNGGEVPGEGGGLHGLRPVRQTVNNMFQQTMSKNEYKNNSSMFTMSQLNNYK